MKAIVIFFVSLLYSSIAWSQGSPITSTKIVATNKLTPPVDTFARVASEIGSIASKSGTFYKYNGLSSSVQQWYPLVPDEVDVFLVAGQSNAVGNAQALSGINAATGTVLQYNAGTLKSINDPATGNAQSPWPAFGVSYYTLTGKRVIIVNTAINGSAQTVKAGDLQGFGNWDTTGTCYGNAIDTMAKAMTYLQVHGYTAHFKGILWIQGETDAIRINSAQIDSTEYRLAFEKMIGRFRTQYGMTTPFYIWKIGTYFTSEDDAFFQVQTVQQNIANGDSLTNMVSYNAPYYRQRGLMNGDSIHWDKTACNEAGRIGAETIINSQGFGWQTQTNGTYFPRGNVGINNALPAFGLQVNRSIAITPDSLPLQTGLTNKQLLLTDLNTSGQLNRISAFDAGVPIAGSVSQVGAATTVFTVTIGVTLGSATYKVVVSPSNVLSAALFYITNKTTTTFDVTYIAGLTGTVAFDWMVAK